MKNARKGRHVRVQFELSDSIIAYLDELKQDLHASSRGEVFKHALAVLRWATDKTTNGYTIVAMKEGEETLKELLNPLLSQAVKST